MYLQSLCIIEMSLYLVQNVFFQGKVSRTRPKTPQDKYQVMLMTRQMFPRSTFFMQYFEDAKRLIIKPRHPIKVPFTTAHYEKLKKKKVGIRLIAHKKGGMSKKKMLNQSGGFIRPLLSIAVPFIASLTASSQ